MYHDSCETPGCAQAGGQGWQKSQARAPEVLATAARFRPESLLLRRLLSLSGDDRPKLLKLSLFSAAKLDTAAVPW